MRLLTITFALLALAAVVIATPLVQEDETDELVAAASNEVGELEASASSYGHGYEDKHSDHGYEKYAHNAYDSYMPKKIVSYKKHGYGHGYGHKVVKYGHVSKHGSDGYTKYDHHSYDKYRPIKPKYVHVYEHHHVSYPKHHSYKHHSYKPYEHHTESHGYESYGHAPQHHEYKHSGYGGHHYEPHYNNHVVTHGSYKYVDHDGSMGHYDGGSGYTKVHGSYSPHHQKWSEKYSNHGHSKHYPKKHHSYY